MLRPERNQYRSLALLDGIWSCQPDPADLGVTDEWYLGLPDPRPIAVPGSWNEQYGDLFFHFGAVWYERRIFVEPSFAQRPIFLRFGSACNTTRVWVNGTFCGDHETAHLPVEVEVTSALRPGEENHVVLSVDASLDPWGLPPAVLQSGEAREGFFNSNPPVSYDFYPYGGIHRSVSLVCVPELRIEDVYIRSELTGASAQVHVELELSKPHHGPIRLSIENEETADLEVMAQSASCAATLTVEQAKLWDIGEPNLYWLCAEVCDPYGKAIDSYRQRFGIRTIEVKDGALLLNGRRVFMTGFGKHEDFMASGRAYNPAVMIKDYDLLRWIGANSFRTSHYPYAEEVIDVADSLGLLVIGETPMVSLNERLYDDRTRRKATSLVERMVRRDRNHPSVIMWSVANEPNIESEAGNEFFKHLMDVARRVDGTRPVTYVAHREPEDNAPLAHADVVCINKYYGWYEHPGDLVRGAQALDDCLERYHRRFGKPIILAEFGADAVAGTHAEPPVMFSEEFQSEMLESQLRVLQRKEYVAGAHVWAFADFRTAMSISRVVVNRKGVFTRERQPKLAAHMLRKLWTEQGPQGAARPVAAAEDAQKTTEKHT